MVKTSRAAQVKNLVRNTLSAVYHLGLKEKLKGFLHFVPFASKSRNFFMLRGKGWESRCKHYDDLYEQYPLAKNSVDTIAGQLIAKGVFLEAVDDTDEAKNALELCEQLNKRLKINVLLHNTAFHMSKYGSCFWEKTRSPIWDMRVIPDQHLVVPHKIDDFDRISWTYADNSKTVWTPNNIIELHRNKSQHSQPYGLSIYVGLDNEFQILAELEEHAVSYANKQAWPYEILSKVTKEGEMASGTEMTDLDNAWANRQPGEGIVTSLDLKLLQGGTGGQPNQGNAEVMKLAKDNIIDGTGVPPISKQWSSTEASAKEMMPWCRDNLIAPMQRIIEVALEEGVYKDYLESEGLSVNLCPTVKWQAPDADFNERVDALVGLVANGVLPVDFVVEELGFDMKKVEQYRAKEDARRLELERFGTVTPQQTATSEEKPLTETKRNTLKEMYNRYERKD